MLGAKTHKYKEWLKSEMHEEILLELIELNIKFQEQNDLKLNSA